MLDLIDAFRLNWNPITVEGYNETKNEVTMVFNCDITTDDKVNDVIKYVVGRTVWCYMNFPTETNITLSFDIRGQGIIINRSSKFKARIFEILNELNIGRHISIDFLR